MTQISQDVQVRQNTDDIDDDTKDPTAPFYELESFSSIWDALQWRHVQNRLPICISKSIRNRYMWANVVYVIYCIGILIINFDPNISNSEPDMDTTASNSTTTIPTESNSVLDDPVDGSPIANRLYVGFGVVHLLAALLYVWAWRDRKWSDVILIPEYMNHIEAILYLWSASWYSRQDTYGGYYTIAVHKIEMTAASVELVASFGWIFSWYMTYIRTLGRGFTFDDPDIIAMLTTTIASIMYFIYNIQVNVQPEQYATNYLYSYADILYFIGAVYYLLASLRDDHWFWFLPLAGQYRVAPGKVQIDTTKTLPSYGKPPILVTNLCRRKVQSGSQINSAGLEAENRRATTRLLDLSAYRASNSYSLMNS